MAVIDFLGSPGGGGQTSIGLEVAQRQALLQIATRLPTELARQEQAWEAIDKQTASELGVAYRQTRLEEPPQSSYYSGVRLGLLMMPWDSFPAVTVMADAGTPTPESARFDQSSMAYSITLYVESLVRSDEYYKDDALERVAEEGTVDRRAKRMLEALVQCVDADRSLGGAVPGLSSPRVLQTDPFTLTDSEAGKQTRMRVFSLVRAEYAVDNYPSHYDSSTEPPDVLLRGLGG